MITLRKLSSLKEGTRRRKFPLLLQQLESEIKNGKKINVQYFQELLKYISSDEFYHEEVRNDMFRFSNQMNTLDKHQLLWKCNSIRYQLLSAIDAEPGDWDFEENESIDRTERIVGDMALFLDGIRSPFNVGSIFRSAESFGIKHIYISRETSSPEYQRAKRSSMGCTDIIPWSYVTVDELPEPIFTLELGGQSLNSFPFPEKGTLIIGSEEIGVSPDGLKRADSSLGRLSIDTGGIKGSINVSVATGIALQKWYSSIF